MVESQIEEHVLRPRWQIRENGEPEASIHDDRMQIFLLAAEKAEDTERIRSAEESEYRR